MKIIAFGHEQGVGKDTAVKFVTSYLRLETSYKRIEVKGFADKVKQIAYELYSWAGLMPGHYYEENGNHPLKNVILPAIGKSPRQLWIDLGNGIRARVHEATWADYLVYNTKCDFLIVNDMRFPTEANYLLERGGYLVKIVRPGLLMKKDGADDQLCDFDKWNHIITNDGTLSDFYNKVVDILKGIING